MPQTALTAYSPNEKTLASIFMEKPMPKLVAFDLDYTLWDLWIDTHVSPPLRRPKESTLNRIVDAYGTPIELYPQVASILHKLHEKQTHIAAASRTSAPDLALQALGQSSHGSKAERGLVPCPPHLPNQRLLTKVHSRAPIFHQHNFSCLLLAIDPENVHKGLSTSLRVSKSIPVQKGSISVSCIRRLASRTPRWCSSMMKREIERSNF
ncbi:hypothetical protein FRC03_003422 [Tulasnella sp. 419]|nr:hypothetical protein FRC03_003422 [Tulasnella sp. 419]